MRISSLQTPLTPHFLADVEAFSDVGRQTSDHIYEVPGAWDLRS